MTRLPLRANGHQLSVPDGTEVLVFEDDGLPPHLAHLSPFSPQLPFPCRTCDAPVSLRISGGAARMTGPCPLPDGITTVITLAVPSGKLIVTDDLRPAWDWRDEDLTASYNSALGQHQAIMTMAAAGCAYGPVLNTSPGLFRTGGDCYVIATPGFDPDPDESLVPAGWQELATTCTDLWAYSIADYEDWQSRDWDRGDRARRCKQDTIVDVTPGTYQFTHHTGERGFRYPHDTGEAVIFTHVERRE